MRRRGGVEAVAVMALVVLALAACGGNDYSALAGPEPWTSPDAVWMQSAGTPLTAGIAVPEGARLVGPVFTLLEEQSEDIAWQTGYLLSDGDPYAVSSDLVNQWDGANNLGEYHRDTLCRQDVGEGVEGKTKSYDYTGDAKAGTVQISCNVGLVLREPQGDSELAQFETGRSLSFTLTKEATPTEAPAQATVGWQPPFVEIPSKLPVAPGGVSGPATAAGDSDWVPELSIVDGSFLAGPAWPGSNGGYVAIIGVSGDPDQVFDSYVAQHPGEAYFEADTVVNGLRVRVFRSAEAGGVWYDVTLNEIDGNAWILLEASND